MLVFALSLLASVISPAPAGATYAGRDGLLAFDVFLENPDCDPDAKACNATQDVARVAASGHGLRTLTTCQLATGVCGGTPSWSHSGRRIAFTGGGGVAVMNADGSGVRAVFGHGSLPAWSPDGRRLVFRHASGNIATIRTDGTDLRQLTTSGRDDSPAWSKSGAIAFVRATDVGADLVSMSSAGTRQRVILRNCGSDPDYSPDGRRIAYRAFGGIRVIKRDGTSVRTLTKDGGDQPTWSPSRRYIAYARFGELRVMRSDGSGSRRIRYPAHEADYGSPSWQPLPR